MKLFKKKKNRLPAEAMAESSLLQFAALDEENIAPEDADTPDENSSSQNANPQTEDNCSPKTDTQVEGIASPDAEAPESPSSSLNTDGSGVTSASQADRSGASSALEADLSDAASTLEIDETEEDADSRSVKSARSLWPLLFFPAALLYHELLLHIFDGSVPFTGLPFLYILLFSAGTGLLVSAILDLLPPAPARILSYFLTWFWTVFTCVEHCCKGYFKTYWGLGFITQMTGNVMGNFSSLILEIVKTQIPFILLSLVPPILLYIFRRKVMPGRKMGHKIRLLALAGFLVLQIAGSVLCRIGSYSADYTYHYATDRAVPLFGLSATTRLELQYSLLGLPEAPEIDLSSLDAAAGAAGSSAEGTGENGDASGSSTDTADTSAAGDDQQETKVLGYHEMDLDFSATSSLADQKTMEKMNQYFSSITPSQENEYTGMFAGKNLIQITAEAFCPYVISEELTPTLYKLTHEGFVFSNYYQPGWGQSTTGGEFAAMTGIIPTWINNNLSFYVSSNDYMPFALGNQFRVLGYTTLAYHDNSYTYYNRNLTHPNLGYDFYGLGNGLDLTVNGKDWPYSDLEMMELTVSDYIDDYVKNKTPFHTYYMTVSGHANWSWGSDAMAAKNREVAEAAYPDASQPVQGYIAANLELEYALEYLMQQLEDAGIADDTVICLTADHYPYALVTDEADYYQELSGTQDSELDISRYRNTLILWCGSMEEPITVDTPCSSIDINPTLSNLFGLEFDSRLMSGHDIFAQNYDPSLPSSCMPLVILPTTRGFSWITAAGTYDSKTGTFTANDGITVSDDYVETVNALIDAKEQYARLMIQYDYAGTVLHKQKATRDITADSASSGKSKATGTAAGNSGTSTSTTDNTPAAGTETGTGTDATAVNGAGTGTGTGTDTTTTNSAAGTVSGGETAGTSTSAADTTTTMPVQTPDVNTAPDASGAIPATTTTTPDASATAPAATATTPDTSAAAPAAAVPAQPADPAAAVTAQVQADPSVVQ